MLRFSKLFSTFLQIIHIIFASDKMVCKESFIVCVCMCVPLVQCPQRLKEGSIPQELEVKGDCKLLDWVLGTKVGFSGGAVNTLNHGLDYLSSFLNFIVSFLYFS